MSATLLEPTTLARARADRTPAGARWGGRILHWLAVLFLTWDTAIKLAGVQQAVDGTVVLGFEPHHLLTIGLIELVCLVAYVIPYTAPLGAVLFTGYLGGAIATHLRLDNPLFSHVLFPIYIAAMLWGALYLRDARVRALLRPEP